MNKPKQYLGWDVEKMRAIVTDDPEIHGVWMVGKSNRKTLIE